MTEPKKTEESKKPDSEAPKKDEATVKAASNITADASKPAEPAKTSDGGANIQTKHTEIKGVPDPTNAPTTDPEAAKGEEAAAKVREAAAKHVDTDPEDDPDYTPPETISDEDLKATIGEVAFQQDINQTETKLAPAAPVKGSAAAAAPSIKRLKSLVYAYPKDAKDGTVVFGYGGISITIGDLRAVVSVL